MKKKNLKLFMALAVVALLTIAGGNLFAAPYFFISPQKQATANQYYGDADNFISPRYFNDMEFSKWFGVVSFQTEEFEKHSGATEMIQVGLAAKFGNIYTALYYGGNTMARPTDTYAVNREGRRSYPDFPALYNLDGTTPKLPHNEGAVLIGVNDMGFRLSYVHEHRKHNFKNIDIGNVLYSTYLNEYGHINPEIAWGMTRDLIPGRGLTPHIYVDMDFFRDYYKYNTQATVGEVIGRSNNEFNLGLTVASGGVTLFEKNNFNIGLDLWYTMGLGFINNEYQHEGQVRKYKGYYSGSINDMAEITGINNHNITPYLYAYWDNEKIALSAELGLDFGFGGYKESDMQMNSAGTLEKDGPETKYSLFSFIPTLDLGLQWTVVPEKFFINVGSSIGFFDLELNKVTIDEDKIVHNVFEGAYTRLMLGFNINPTINLGFQAMAGVDIDTNNISTFRTTGEGLAVFSKIMATLKF